MVKEVFQFYEGSAGMKEILGGKGANLAEMTNLGLPVPKGFTITTGACIEYLNSDQTFSQELNYQVMEALAELELATEKKFNDPDNPLLVSVRSGGVYSMPGMMDTILNLGLNDTTVVALAKLTDNPRFAYDCYRRLLQMFGEVVFGIDKNRFEQYLTYLKEQKNYQGDPDLTAEDWQQVVAVYQEIYLEVCHKPFPQEPSEQLFLAIEAVFRSWNNQRAIVYRNLHNLNHESGTAVNIQTMVFGNSGEESGTGVAFTRNPSTGENKLFGEFLLNAQGEDVVAGIRTPLPIADLQNRLPKVYDEFLAVANTLEKHYADMQDIEFTVENGKLYFLQTRNGKRTAAATLRIAYELVQEKIITKEDAVMRIEPQLIDQLLHPIFSTAALQQGSQIAKGLPASPGAASGKVYFDAEQAKAAVANGEKVILVRQETSPEDIEGMIVSQAIVTSRGGMTSHAAVVARGMGTCCVAGCEALKVDEFLKTIQYAGGVIREGDVISVDGSQGTIYLGEIPTEKSEENLIFKEVLNWADELAELKVRANGETPKDIQTAIHFGATGIGLARTEHMFFEGPRLKAMRQLILAEDQLGRKQPLVTLLRMQTEDFAAIFTEVENRAIVIRLLDPPLHEFLPHTSKEIEQVAEELSMSVANLTQRVGELSELNPMLGHRGCRLAVTYPEIYRMQVRAIMQGACIMKERGVKVAPEIMIPLVGSEAELTQIKADLITEIEDFFAEQQVQIDYTIGTMIELPRACVIADKLVENADFFSFGTNDLTQMTFGFSRDDAGKYIQEYLAKGILKADPFQTVDQEGVGSLLQMAVDKARAVKPNFKIGVCGEVGGDPQSIEFFHQLGLSYVSCSPYRVPIARIAVAQAAVRARS